MGIKIGKANDSETISTVTHTHTARKKGIEKNIQLKNKLNTACSLNGELDLRLICQHQWRNHIFDLFATKWTFASGKCDRLTYIHRERETYKYAHTSI